MSSVNFSARSFSGRLRIFGLAIAVGWSAGGAAAAAPHGYSLSGGDLLRVDMASGEVTVAGATGLDPSATALTFGPGDSLYGFGSVGGDPALRRIDPLTGVGEAIGPVPYPVDGLGLAATGDGMLWMTDTQDLYRVDPDTGAATFQVTLGEAVFNLASRGGELYGFTLDTNFHRIDTATGALQPLFVFGEGVFVTGASFDGRGVLWYLTVPQGGVLEFVTLTAYRVTDVDAGDYEPTFEITVPFTDVRFDMRPVAMPQTVSAVDIPAVGAAGAVVLVLGLVGGGLVVLRRRRGL